MFLDQIILTSKLQGKGETGHYYRVPSARHGAIPHFVRERNTKSGNTGEWMIAIIHESKGVVASLVKGPAISK